MGRGATRAPSATRSSSGSSATGPRSRSAERKFGRERAFEPPSSSAKWAGKDDVLYSIDYQRGIDILRYRGEHYVPGAAPESGCIPGTNGETPPLAPTPEQAAQRSALAQKLKATGWSPALCYLSPQRI